MVMHSAVDLVSRTPNCYDEYDIMTNTNTIRRSNAGKHAVVMIPLRRYACIRNVKKKRKDIRLGGHNEQTNLKKRTMS